MRERTKMDAQLFAKRGPRFTVWVGFTVWIGFGLLAGCGGSSEPAAAPSGTVTPGSGSSADANMNSADVPSMEAPGGMQLPDDATIVVPSGDAEKPKSGGFTLPTDADTQTSRKPPLENSETSEASTREIEAQVADWDAIAAKAKSAGKITIIDLWSLSCEPCLKEFPGLVRLHQTYADQVQCIAANVDFDGRKRRPPEYYRDSVEAFLASVDAGGFTSYICATPSDEVFEATDIISIPTVLIYDADGKQIHKFVDAGETIGFTYEKDIAPLIEKLVARQGRESGE